MMNHNQIIWQSNVEYNKVGSKIYLIKQNSDEVYTFENVAFEIVITLSIMKQCSMEELVKEIEKVYELTDESKREIIEFVEKLAQEQIVKIQHHNFLRRDGEMNGEFGCEQ